MMNINDVILSKVWNVIHYSAYQLVRKKVDVKLSNKVSDNILLVLNHSNLP